MAGWELGQESLRTKATMSVVHQHVAPQRQCGIVIDTACAVCDIPHNYRKSLSKSGEFQVHYFGRVNNRYSPFDDVRNGTGKHLEAFGHLQGDHLGVILSDMVDSFVYLEGVIRGQLFNGIVELHIR